MKLKWKCPNCGALHSSQEALTLLLSKAFVPVNAEEEQPKVEKIVKHAPAPKPKAEPKEELDEFDEEPEEEEKEEDLSLE